MANPQRGEVAAIIDGNRLAVESDAGDWEIIGFAMAELLGPGEYRLSRLLRGRGGTDWAMKSCAVGRRIVILDDRPQGIGVPGAWLGGTVDLRAFAGSTNVIGTDFEADLGLGPVLPLAPVHLRAERAAGGSDVMLSWIRRSRSDSDSWATADAPLELVPESYRVTVFNGLTAVRTLDVGAPTATYGATEQTADFGVVPAAFSFAVAQVSPVHGAGHAATGSFAA